TKDTKGHEMLSRRSRFAVSGLVLGVLVALLFEGGYTQARPGSATVVIDEVAWAGTAASSSDEWIELKNNSAIAVDLTGWTLTDGGDVDIALSGSLAAQSFFLLERTDDTTISDIAADQIYVGNLSNSGESLTLKDGNGA